MGNITAGCIPCNCNTLGARSTLCNAITGACDCQPGVEGIFCDKCLPQHYGYSDSGCSSKYYSFYIYILHEPFHFSSLKKLNN
ncbi:hypothetical protein O3M35_004989 [Rhynocoris fuscipes]|uniref:Laminin EGF-like domain-containing protein n=1 Tax=Rhynocoris fuscipes TaxID=488301 RepID=A0AAW1DKC0_9HEMI